MGVQVLGNYHSLFGGCHLLCPFSCIRYVIVNGYISEWVVLKDEASECVVIMQGGGNGSRRLRGEGKISKCKALCMHAFAPLHRTALIQGRCADLWFFFLCGFGYSLAVKPEGGGLEPGQTSRLTAARERGVGWTGKDDFVPSLSDLGRWES